MKSQVEMFGMSIDRIRMAEAVERIFEWIARPEGACRYVVTPNVDHVVIFQQHAELRRAYEKASLVLADGMPVVLASRLLGRTLPERVPGSDLAPALFAAATAQRPLRVYLLGAAPGVAEIAARKIEQSWPAVQVVGVFSPPLGFEKDQQQNREILKRIALAQPDLLIVGLGAPKQELWLAAHRQAICAPVALAIGATIDFLAGQRSRAPVWMQRCGLEWLHRVCSEPRRLMGRYARDAWIFPQLVWRQWREDRRGRRLEKAPSRGMAA